MTHEELLNVLEPVGISWAYEPWGTPPPPPYGVYMDEPDDPFFADDGNYFSAHRMRLEIYSTVRDPALDAKVKEALAAAGIPYETDFDYLESEALYESIFEIEV